MLRKLYKQVIIKDASNKTKDASYFWKRKIFSYEVKYGT